MYEYKTIVIPKDQENFILWGYKQFKWEQESKKTLLGGYVKLELIRDEFYAEDSSLTCLQFQFEYFISDIQEIEKRKRIKSLKAAATLAVIGLMFIFIVLTFFTAYPAVAVVGIAMLLTALPAYYISMDHQTKQTNEIVVEKFIKAKDSCLKVGEFLYAS